MQQRRTCCMSPTPPVTTSTPAVEPARSAACAARICETISAESRPGRVGREKEGMGRSVGVSPARPVRRVEALPAELLFSALPLRRGVAKLAHPAMWQAPLPSSTKPATPSLPLSPIPTSPSRPRSACLSCRMDGTVPTCQAPPSQPASEALPGLSCRTCHGPIPPCLVLQQASPALSQMMVGIWRSARAKACIARLFLPGVRAARSSTTCAIWWGWESRGL